MKNIKYIISLLSAAVIATGCYKDKGEYNTSEWTGIISVDDMELEGLSGSTYDLLEGQVIACSPTIRFKAGVDESKVVYRWVLGKDTVAYTKNLNWAVIRPAGLSPNKTIPFFLVIRNNATGEEWAQSFRSNSDIVSFRITPERLPKVGLLIYQKSDNTIEYGSVRGTSATPTKSLNTLLLDLYKYYDPLHIVQGPLAAATNMGSMLVTYTNVAPEYGAIAATTQIDPSIGSSGTILGENKGSVGQQIFMGNPVNGTIKSANTYGGSMDILIGTQLYISTTTSGYIPIIPGVAATETNIEQTMPVNPETGIHSFGIFRNTSNDIVYYPPKKIQYKCWVTLKNDVGATLKADEIVGVFRQPKAKDDNTNAAQNATKMFVVVRTGTSYVMYCYNLSPVAASYYDDNVTFISKTDVTAWAGGMTSSTIWFTNSNEVPLNYMYIAKGNQLWRTSSESLATPTAVKTFADPITTLQVVHSSLSKNEPDRYTAVFTYNSASGKSKMHMLDLTTAGCDAFTDVPTLIDGKVVKYIPIY